MTELYLQIVDRILTPILLVLAVFLFLRGHNLPGGGFIAGLMAAAAFELQILTRGESTIRRAVGPYLHSASGLGLLLAATAGTAGLFDGNVFDGVWFHIPLGPLGELEMGTPLLFDAGVFLVVVSVTTSYLLGLNHLAEAEQS